MRREIDNRQMAIGLMNLARTIFEAADNGELFAGMQCDSFDPVGNLRHDLGHRGAVVVEFRDEYRRQGSFAPGMAAVGDDDPPSVDRESTGERTVLIRNPRRGFNFALIGDLPIVVAQDMRG